MDSPYQVLDDRFLACTRGDLRLEKRYGDCRWAEGPVWFAAGRYLVWSDIPNDRMLRLDETTGTVGVFRAPAGYTNGNTVDAQGRMVSCEQGNRRITRTEPDGSVTVLADRYRGQRFNSPNDVVVAADGAIWFTDPDYGCDTDYEGHGEPSEIGACHVYRVDPSGEVRIATDDMDHPNGLAFSPDGSRLYVADTRAAQIRAFDVLAGGALAGGAVLVGGCPVGVFDGIRLDTAGRIWAGIGDGVACYHPDGTLLGRIRVPELVANLCFGGPKRSDLYLAAGTSLYSIRLSCKGAAPVPGRALG